MKTATTTRNTKTTTTAAAVNPAPLYTITLATIEGDKTTFSTMQATTHAAALQAVNENNPAATVRAYYSPFGDTLPLAALHTVCATLSGIAKRAKPAETAQQAVTGDNYARVIAQLSAARRTLHNVARHGPEAIAIPHDIQDYFQAAALALINHAAPLATVKPLDIQAAYRAAMGAIQKAYRADTRGTQQAAAGHELPRLHGSPTMRTSTPRRPCPKAYLDAIAAIRQALPSEQARAVFAAWLEHPDATIRDIAEYVNGKKSPTARHMAKIKETANALYPNGIPAK